MKYYISLWMLIFLIACNAKTVKNNSSELIEIQFSVQYTSEYCGGAYPPDEVLKALDVERPLKNKELIIKRKDADETYSLMCDAKGVASLSLPQGQYLVFYPIKMTAEPSENALSVEQCAQWKKTPDTAFAVTADTKNIDLKVRQTCNPCEAPRA